MERKISTTHQVNPLIVALILTALFLLLTATLKAQNVAINTDGSKADPNAIVDIKSSSKGLLIPRMTTAQRIKIPQTTGLMVFDVTTKSFWYSDGESWKDMASSELSVATTDAWLLTGNAATVDGTNFLGTTDNVPLNFRVNNQKAGRIDPILNNTFMGYRSAFMVTTANNNTGIGASVLFHLTDGHNNTAIGSNALQTNGGGHGNTAVGRMAMLNNTTGAGNTAVGLSALIGNTTGTDNIAIGGQALSGNQTGNRNIAIGGISMWLGSGNSNVAIGGTSLFYNTGNENTAIGTSALSFNHGGSFNTGLGSGARTRENAMNSTAIGYNAFADGSNSTALGNGAIANASNKVRIGNAAVTVIEGQVPFSFPSDGRYKFNVKEDVHGLDFIMQLRPVTYQFDVKRFDGLSDNAVNVSDLVLQTSYNEALRIRRSGFIAQEVEKAAVSSGYNFSGLNKPKTEMDHYSLSYESFVVPLVKAVQEQQQLIQDQNKKIADLQKELAEIKSLLKSSK